MRKESGVGAFGLVVSPDEEGHHAFLGEDAERLAKLIRNVHLAVEIIAGVAVGDGERHVVARQLKQRIIHVVLAVHVLEDRRGPAAVGTDHRLDHAFLGTDFGMELGSVGLEFFDFSRDEAVPDRLGRIIILGVGSVIQSVGFFQSVFRVIRDLPFVVGVLAVFQPGVGRLRRQPVETHFVGPGQKGPGGGIEKISHGRFPRQRGAGRQKTQNDQFFHVFCSFLLNFQRFLCNFSDFWRFFNCFYVFICFFDDFSQKLTKYRRFLTKYHQFRSFF